MMPIKFVGFVIMLLFIIIEARQIPNKLPKYQGIVVTKVASQSYEHGRRVNNPPNIPNKNMLDYSIKEVEDNNMKSKGRKTTNEVDFEEKSKATKDNSSNGGRGNFENSGQSKDWSRNSNIKATTFEDQNNKEKTSGYLEKDSIQKLESQEAKAKNEVWTLLMNKDYPGNGKAHHNPPINNP
ncbi:hypothetical protein RND81_10G210500 [Saponaria officinalis]|uniref:Uncharacterized protein n=1 Tax=Saponaria officinalis TaxID=3572 RepID=A0AAW1I742_SAPOF